MNKKEINKLLKDKKFKKNRKNLNLDNEKT